MATVILDTFTDINGTLLQDHTPELGGPWFQIESREDVIIENNAIIAAGPVFTGDRYLNDFTIPSDGTVSAGFTDESGGSELYCRSTSIRRGYFLKINADSLQIFKRTAQGATLLATTSGLTPLPGNVSFKFEGVTLQGIIGGDVKVQAQDNSYSSGLVGIFVTGFRTADNFSLDTDVPCSTLTPTPPDSWFDAMTALFGTARASLMVRTVDLSNGAFNTVFLQADIFDT